MASKGRTGLSVKDIWNGHDINQKGDADPYYTIGDPNAWLSINRHRRNSTVQLGPEGGTPQSIWVLSYSNFERLYYNLVAHYQEWESLDHKLATWRHMSYVRLEGEDLAISFLPEQVREAIRARFTQGLGEIKQMRFFPHHSMARYPSFTFGPRKAETPKVRSGDPDAAIQDLVLHTKNHLKDVQGDHAGRESAVDTPDSDLHAKLIHLANDSRRQGAGFAAFMPDVSYIRVRRSSGDQVFSLIADRAYQAHNIIFIEDQNRLPQNDVLSVYRGFVGAFPNVFFDLKEGQVPEFVSTVRHLASVGNLGRGVTIDETAFLRTLGKYAVSRTSPQFWDFYDWLHSYKGHKRPGVDPVAEAIIDLQQYVFF